MFENGTSVQLWVRNLNKEEYLLGTFPGVLQTGTINAFPN
jgi:iron complex outermembrane receptor protein